MPESSSRTTPIHAPGSLETRESSYPAPQASTPRKKKRALRNTLIVLGILVVLLGIAAGIAYAIVSSTFDEIRRVSITQDPELTRPAATQTAPDANAPINILLLGSDSRQSQHPSTKAVDATGFRSDAILVAQVSPDRRRLTLMSIMRDNWVPIQGVGEAKINAAIAAGGPSLAVNTVENFIDARIDHLALIDFESFTALTDAVGGVTVHNEVPFTSQQGGDFTFKKGDITLTGDTALAFVRERYAFPDGDYQRVRNQQAYLSGLMKKLLSSDTLGSVDTLIDTFQAVKPYLILDEQLDLGTAVSLGFELRNLKNTDIAFFTSPTLGTGTSADGQSIVLPDWDALKKVQTAIRSGTLNEYAATQHTGSELPAG